MDFRCRKLISQDKAVHGGLISQVATILPIHTACGSEPREILARHGPSILFTDDDQFFTIAALSIAKQPSKPSSFFPFFFWSSRLQKRPAGRRMSTAG